MTHSAAYTERLASPEWARLRAAVSKAQRGRCKGCGRKNDHEVGTPLELHHLHYRTLGREKPADVVLLCKYCHEVADKKRKCETDARVWAARVQGFAETAGFDSLEDAEDALVRWLEANGEG